MRPRTGIAAFATLVGVAGVLAVATGAGTAAYAASANGNKVKAGDLLVSGTIYTAPNIAAATMASGSLRPTPRCRPRRCPTTRRRCRAA